ncbi:MAG: HEAT repeat domain-containing protein [Planctomycetaceae bacterium]|nr:HEAT repeat domain-containing protein [Planctomycetaceae bacterium]
MTIDEQAILNEVNANKWAVLYRCRWSQPDADRIVPQLIRLLDSTDPLIIQESLRALFRIGKPASPAAHRVAAVTRAKDSMTRRLAVLALGQIAHEDPEVCVEPLVLTLSDPACCQDALRALAFIGSAAASALHPIKPLLSNADARVRKAAVIAAAEIGASDPEIVALIQNAATDGHRAVRDAANKCLQNIATGSQSLE